MHSNLMRFNISIAPNKSGASPHPALSKGLTTSGAAKVLSIGEDFRWGEPKSLMRFRLCSRFLTFRNFFGRINRCCRSV